MNPKENLPQQICDLCIVQLNVSYNFKRLALKNDFYIRQYMIENGMNLLKEDDVDDGIETALEIHQIHNVIRTTNRRPLIAPPPPPQITTTTSTTTTTTVSDMRRNSTTSSVSGVSAMLINGSETNGTSRNALIKAFNVRPIQIKTEPIDPDYEDVNKQSQTIQSSPTNSNNSLSILTINSSSGVSSASRAKTPPMIVINGRINTSEKTPKKLPSVVVVVKESPRNIERPPPRKASLKQQDSAKKNEQVIVRNKVRDLRTIKKPLKHLEAKKKLREAAKRLIDKKKKEKLKNQRMKLQGTHKKGDKKLGRPPKIKKKAPAPKGKAGKRKS